MLRASCPRCRAAVTAPPAAAGKKSRCPSPRCDGVLFWPVPRPPAPPPVPWADRFLALPLWLRVAAPTAAAALLLALGVFVAETRRAQAEAAAEREVARAAHEKWEAEREAARQVQARRAEAEKRQNAALELPNVPPPNMPAVREPARPAPTTPPRLGLGDVGVIRPPSGDEVFFAANAAARDADGVALMVAAGRVAIVDAGTPARITGTGFGSLTVRLLGGRHAGREGVVSAEFLHAR